MDSIEHECLSFKWLYTAYMRNNIFGVIVNVGRCVVL